MKDYPVFITFGTLSLLFGYVFGLDVGENCLTPGRENGKCIGIRDCRQYSDLLDSKSVPPEIISLLKKSRCGILDGKPLLCCPSDGTLPQTIPGKLENKCQTPSGLAGKCVIRSECPVFSASAASPVTLQLLQQSHCGHDGKMDMYCCPAETEEVIMGDFINHRNINLLNIHNCGPVKNIKILHADGSKSEQYGFPWVALISYSGNPETTFRCIGSLISKRYILTAAHCLKYIRGNVQPISVKLGELNLETTIDCTEDECTPFPQEIGIEKTIIHPMYKGWPNYEHDVALLRLARDADLNTLYVQPVCLPIGMPHETKELIGEELLVSGWCTYENNKRLPVLLQKKIKGLSHEECVLLLKKEVPISPNSQLCTTSEKNSDCQGYGGSPLVHYDNRQRRKVATQYGITSFGPKHCRTPDIPSVYTRLSRYTKWILDQMER